MAYDDIGSMHFIDGQMIDIEKLSSEEADALSSVIEEKIKTIEDELKQLIISNEREAI